MNKNILVFEHHQLHSCNENCTNCRQTTKTNCISHCSQKHFNELKEYAENIPHSFCGFFYSKKSNSIKFGKYAGLLQLSDGTYIEILPKIADQESAEHGRIIFINLLNASHNLTKEYKEFNEINAKTLKSNSILELYINIFCNDLAEILKKGFKKAYIKAENNLPVYKGKIKFQNHIKYNGTNPTHFFVEYNNFNLDIPENRLLKSACLTLLHKTTSQENKKILSKFLTELNSITLCNNLPKDIQSKNINRLHSYYKRPVLYAEFFLKNELFFPQHGRKKLTSLLFPLNEMFEDYIEQTLKTSAFTIKKQFSKHYLIINEKNTQCFNTKMDFLVEINKYILIFDAKWKKICSNDKNYGVAQSDLYQLFSYAEIIKQKQNKNVAAALLYPSNPNFNKTIQWNFFNDIPLFLIPIDPTSDTYSIRKPNRTLSYHTLNKSQ